MESLQTLYDEAEIYARVGPHENLVTFKGLDKNGLLLEYCERGGLHNVIEEPTILTDEQNKEISMHIVRGLLHLHEHHFIHCDLHLRNIFLTSGMVAKIRDLQGQLSRPDGSIEMETMSQENAKSRHPHARDDEFSSRTDIFALGTLLYHLWHRHMPFPELDEHTHRELIKERYRTGQYPIDLSQAAGIDAIIGKCWTSSYQFASEILDDLNKLDRHGMSIEV